MNDRQSELDFLDRTQLIAGVDEVGRGPLAGPVIAAAVILDPNRPVTGLRDSKKLSEKKRIELDIVIRDQALAYATGRAEVHEIDELNILHASMLAMKRAIESLSVTPQYLLVDGNRLPETNIPGTAVVKGDDREDSIAAASIIAKVMRDNELMALHEHFPNYGFDRHKGYPTRQHIQALHEHGVTEHHRRSFRPVKEAMS